MEVLVVDNRDFSDRFPISLSLKMTLTLLQPSDSEHDPAHGVRMSVHHQGDGL